MITSERFIPGYYSMLRKGLILLAVSLSLSIATFGQGPEGRFGVTEAGGAGPETERRPIILSGSVVLASGGPPGEPIMIKRICGTRIIPEAYTDRAGQFTFQIGGNPAMAVMDSTSSGIGASSDSGTPGASFGGLGRGDTATTGIDLSGCIVVTDAPGFQSKPIPLGRRRSLDRSDIGTFILTPIEGAQASTVSVTSVQAPKKARSAYEKGLKELQKGPTAKTDKAIAELQKAIEIYPEYAAAWTDLGQAKLQLGDSGGAKAAFEKALASDSRYIRPYAPLARITIGEQDWARTLKLAEVVLSVTPADAQMRWFRAVSQFELRDLDDAASSLGELHHDEAAEKQFPQSHHLLGMIYASRGEIKEAASEYQRYLELSPDASPGDGVRQQLSDWERQGVI